MTSEKQTGRPRERLLPSVRQDQIVRTAHDILVTEGYAALSYSRIAKLCGIRLSTVQHHFPDRALLIDAVMQQLVDELLGRYDALALEIADDPAVRLEAMVRLLASDMDKSDVMSLFFELWAFSQRDAAMARAIESIYSQVRTHLCGLIESVVPGISRHQALNRAVIVMAMADGLTVTMSHKAARSAQLEGVDRGEMVSRLLRLAREG